MEIKKVQRRVLFKEKGKDKYISTHYWHSEKIDDIPFGLKEDFERIVALVNSDEIIIKVERKIIKEKDEP